MHIFIFYTHVLASAKYDLFLHTHTHTYKCMYAHAHTHTFWCKQATYGQSRGFRISWASSHSFVFLREIFANLIHSNKKKYDDEISK